MTDHLWLVINQPRKGQPIMLVCEVCGLEAELVNGEIETVYKGH